MSDDKHVSPFEQIRYETEDGSEYWSARELSKVLGYLNWRNFEPVIEKAETACAGSGHAVSDHFARTRTLIETGKGARREVDDVQLSRYACYLVVQNADPSKEIVALGQTYFGARSWAMSWPDSPRRSGGSTFAARLRTTTSA